MLAAYSYYAHIERLRTCLGAEMEEDIKARYHKLEVDRANIETVREKRKAHRKPLMK
jgi:vacuolar-type H+-ATPase subunit C/Vma6